MDRALSLLTLAYPRTPVERLTRWSIGQRDVQLLKLRKKIFGPRITGQADCPGCGEQVVLNFAVTDVCAKPSSETDEVLTLETAGYDLRFRLPNSVDLAGISAASMPTDASPAQYLLQRCVVSARHRGDEISADRLPAEVVEAVSEKMSEADPQGDVQLALNCPRCSHRWHAQFDIVSFLWSEIHAWAIRLLQDVHTLALAYSWRESDILTMNPWRRQAYLELIGQ